MGFYRLVIFVSLFVLTFANARAGAGSSLYFRWGDFETNRQILEAGGFPGNAGAYDADLYSGGSARYNQAVYDLLARWNARNGDAAGTGLYASSDLFDSKSYGGTRPSLLVIEVEDPVDLRPVRRSQSWKVADATAVGNGIRIRPPSPDDVKIAWNQLIGAVSEREARSRLTSIADELLKHYEFAQFPRSTQIFLERMIFDESAGFFKKDLERISKASPDPAAETYFKTLFSLFLSKAPDHPVSSKLAKLFLHWNGADKKWFENHVGYDPDIVIGLDRYMSPSMRALVLQDFDQPDYFSNYATRFNRAKILAHFSKYLPRERRAKLAENIRSSLSIPNYADLTPGFSETVEKILGKKARLDHEKGLLKAKFDTIFLASDQLVRDMPYSDGERVLSGIRRDVIAAIEKPHPALAEFLAELTATPPRRGWNSQWWQLYFRLLESLQDRRLTLAGKKIVSNALRLLKEQLPKETSVWNVGRLRRSGLTPLLFELLETNPSPEMFMFSVKAFSDDFPSLKETLESDLKSFRINPGFQAHPLQMTILQAIDSVKGGGDSRGVIEAAKRMGDAAIEGIIPRRERFVNTHWENIFENIPGSPEYSRVSRTFVLVDPILVSEDLRRMNAAKPWQRFNEKYVQDGRETTQPAWENLIRSWEVESAEMIVGKSNAPYKVGMSLVASKVEGALNAGLANRYRELDLNYRNSLAPEFPMAEWQLAGGPALESHLERFFELTKAPDKVILRFRGFRDALDRNGIKDFDPGETPSERAFQLISRRVTETSDPIKRAALILDLVPKIHPLNNGNGRLARFWASLELAAAGQPIPVGLPTNDFFMSPERLELEVRKSIALGRFWRAMLVKANREGIKPEEFFQRVFRGSSLEGLMHATPRSDSSMKKWVQYLERLESPPSWAGQFMKRVEAEITALDRNGTAMGEKSELYRQNLLTDTWEKFVVRLEVKRPCAMDLFRGLGK